jgi:Flp pilus assembly protein TadD
VCLKLEGLGDDQLARARELERYIAEQRWIFRDAVEIVQPHIHLQDRSSRPIDEPATRKRLARAVETLEAHYDDFPSHWQSIWMAAKGRAALGHGDRALALWRSAWQAHPDQADIVRELGHALLERDLVREARKIDRDATKRMPDDSKLWCNRAITEVLCGDLAKAQRCVAKSRKLDPEDPIANTLASVLDTLDERALPKTLAELQAGARRRPR